MKYLSGAALAAVLALSACGGGDGGSTPATGGGGGGGGGTPTPTPGPTYTKFVDLTGQQTFQTSCGGEELFNGQRSPLGGTPFGDAVRIVSDRSGPTYDVTVDNIGFDTARALNFTQANLDPSSTPTSERYNFEDGSGRTQRFSIFVPSINDVELEYTRIATLFSPSPNGFVNLICAIGAPTELNDEPAGSVNFINSTIAAGLRVVENAAVVGAGPTRQYSTRPTAGDGFADPATGEIRFSLNLKGFEIIDGSPSTTETDLGVYTGTTTIDGTLTQFSGTVVNSDNVVSGTFGGWFFGPEGRTMAVSYSILDRRPDGSDTSSAGVLILRR